MTYKRFSEFVRAADERPLELFLAGWLLMPDCEKIPGWDPADLDRGKQILTDLYRLINLSPREIRERAGLTQQAIADRFAIPLRTWQGWETGRACPVYLRLLLMQQLGVADMTQLLGVN